MQNVMEVFRKTVPNVFPVMEEIVIIRRAANSSRGVKNVGSARKGIHIHQKGLYDRDHMNDMKNDQNDAYIIFCFGVFHFLTFFFPSRLLACPKCFEFVGRGPQIGSKREKK